MVSTKRCKSQTDREKLRQIWRPSQVKVIFVNFCHLLSPLPMIPKLLLRKKKKTNPKDPHQHFSCLQRKPSTRHLGKRTLWHGKGSYHVWIKGIFPLTKPLGLTAAWKSLSITGQNNYQLSCFPWQQHLQTRLSRKRSQLVQKERMEMLFTFVIMDFFLQLGLVSSQV